MNKTEIIAAVAEKAGTNKKVASEVIDALFDCITGELANGGSVQFVGFGTFETRERSERQGKNPKTGEVITIAATKVPAFKPGSELKKAAKKA